MVDEIQVLGVSWNMLSVTVYLFLVWLLTGKLKKKLKLKTWRRKVAHSWAVGAIVFAAIGLFFPAQITFRGVLQYFFLTLLLNGAYKGSTLLWDLMAAAFPFIPARKKNEPQPPAPPQSGTDGAQP